MSLEDDLRLLMDKQAIAELNYRLCHLIDSFQLDRMVNEIYAPDGSDDHGGGPVVGRDAIRAWYEDSTANVAAIAHNIANVIVEVDGDHAVMRSNVISWTWTVANTDAGPMRPADYALSVTYEDTLTRYPEGWRINSRVLISNVSKTGQAMVLAIGELPATQKGIQALAKKAPPAS